MVTKKPSSKSKTPPPIKETLLQRLDRTAREKKLERFSQESMKWFIGKARSVNRDATTEELLAGKAKKGLPALGRLYVYKYDPKTKDDMPYYDTFPMIFLVDFAERGWYGLNVHYLPPKARAILLDSLIELATNKKYPAHTRLNLTYGALKSASKYALFKPCFKRYLASHVKSRIVEIPFHQWEAALFLPVAQFQKAVNNKVWSDSILSTKG